MRGKLRTGLAPKRKDWHDILMTLISTDVPEEEIMRMTPRQRWEARKAQEKVDGDNWYPDQAYMRQ